ncbi:hypothetical protein WA1_10530 [Scytonema hofmannii PCC 7110]|uniref:Uncharacterized protein n=1 Tax=Scytonema hofmannii PCC 7110 TaxID=128403 RepID=A0A139XFQ3_9CYAN|nr:hypothetical protein [Scytonema hofmannii]KYC43493.1 hypothetical protein WA1_10530 [Scytonema hofmannii PCC 7110]
MHELYSERNVAIVRITKIIEKLIEDNSLYRERLDKEGMIQHLAKFVDKFSPEYVKSIPHDELVSIIDSILVIEAVSGTLNDLTPEQIKMYDEAVEGR